MTNDWDKAKGGVGELTPEYCLESIREINNFFDERIIPYIINSKWDLCINAVRNGESVFSEQMRRNKLIGKKEIINDHEIDKFGNKIKSSRILLFDDSIKKGFTIEEILDKIMFYNPTCISIATILCPIEVSDYLKKRYPLVKEIIVANAIYYSPEDRFSEINYKHYLQKIESYSMYTCLPMQDGNTHPYALIKVKPGCGGNLVESLKQYGMRSVSDISERYSFIGRGKISLCLQDGILNAVAKKADFDISYLGNIFIRIFWREDIQMVILQPIIRNYEYLDNYEENEIKMADLKMKCELLNFFKKILSANDEILSCRICLEREFIHGA